MAGYVIPCVSKQTISFAQAAGAGPTIVADRVSLVRWREATLMLRIHSHTLTGGAGTISVSVIGQTTSVDDPGLAFLDDSTAVIRTYDATTPSPFFTTFGFSEAFFAQPANFPPMFRVTAQGNRTGPGVLAITLSLALSVKDL
jgi:hypothetical protein